MIEHKLPCPCSGCVGAMRDFIARIHAREEQPEEVKKRLPSPLTVRTDRPDVAGRLVGAGPAPIGAGPAPDCFHLGYAWSASDIAQQGLNPQREYRACALGMGERPGFVCKCLECGPQCFWFDPSPHDDLDLGEE